MLYILSRIYKFHFAIVFTLMLVGCSDDEPNSALVTLKGTVVVSPTSYPIQGVMVKITNGKSALVSTTTDNIGMFSISFNRNEIDSSYFLSLTVTPMNITKIFDIVGIGQTEHDYGTVVLYDINNPYELTSFQYNGYTYVVHPVLREQYAQTEAKNICNNLSDLGIDNWFLPSKDELWAYFKSRTMKEMELDVPNGNYWTTSEDMYVYKNFSYSEGVSYGGWPTENTLKKYYIVPMHRYK